MATSGLVTEHLVCAGQLAKCFLFYFLLVGALLRPILQMGNQLINVTEANMDPLTQCVAKHIYQYQAVVKESTAFVARHSTWSQAKITGSSCSKDPNAPVVFREDF